MPEILFAEDEAILGKLVKEALEREPDFHVTWVRDGKEAIRQFELQTPDICILDVMMPALSGFIVAKEISERNATVPIIFLTARSETADVISGFESGGNDYLKKPFSIEELMVRVKELLRRHKKNEQGPASYNTTDNRYDIGIFRFCPATQTLKNELTTHQLSHRETELLHDLIIHKNNVLDRKTALIRIWGDDNFFNARTMDVYIGKLRKYLSTDPALSIINIRGRGYKLIEHSKE